MASACAPLHLKHEDPCECAFCGTHLAHQAKKHRIRHHAPHQAKKGRGERICVSIVADSPAPAPQGALHLHRRHVLHVAVRHHLFAVGQGYLLDQRERVHQRLTLLPWSTFKWPLARV